MALRHENERNLEGLDPEKRQSKFCKFFLLSGRLGYNQARSKLDYSGSQWFQG